MNKVILTGRLTEKPEKQSTAKGTSAVTFNLAVDKFSNGEKGTNFVRCVAYSNKADFLANYCGKGDKVGVEGSLEVRNYEKNGQKVYITEVLCDRVELEAKAQNNAQSAPKRPQKSETFVTDDADDLFEYSPDDLPF